MKTDIIVKTMLKNLAVLLVSHFVTFSFMAFTIFNSFSGKVDFQQGTIGQAIVSAIVAYILLAAMSLPPILVVSSVLTFLEVRRVK